MNDKAKLFLGFALVVAFGLLMHDWKKEDAAPTTLDPITQLPAAAKVVRPPALSPEEVARQRQVEQKMTEQRMSELSQKAKNIGNVNEAANNTAVFRRRIAMTVSDQWQSLLRKNLPEWQALVVKAQVAENGRVDCTICKGDHYLDFCLLCKSDNPMCRTCEGSGKTLGGGVCPTCLGSRWCFMCNGTSEMICPFCDDGEVDRVLSAEAPELKMLWE